MRDSLQRSNFKERRCRFRPSLVPRRLPANPPGGTSAFAQHRAKQTSHKYHSAVARLTSKTSDVRVTWEERQTCSGWQPYKGGLTKENSQTLSTLDLLLQDTPWNETSRHEKWWKPENMSRTTIFVCVFNAFVNTEGSD